MNSNLKRTLPGDVVITLTQDFHYQNWIVRASVNGETTYSRESNNYQTAVQMFNDLVKYGA